MRRLPDAGQKIRAERQVSTAIGTGSAAAVRARAPIWPLRQRADQLPNLATQCSLPQSRRSARVERVEQRPPALERCLIGNSGKVRLSKVSLRGQLERVVNFDAEVPCGQA